MANAVIVADMLREFMEPGHALYCGDDARKIIPNVQLVLENELKRGSKIYFIADHHIPDDPEFKLFPPHSIAGTAESEVIPELAKYPGEIVPKRRYSSFAGTGLAAKLKRLKPDKLIICGVLTNICVLHTAIQAFYLGYKVEVPVDCVASPDEASHRWALNHMEKVLGVKLTRAKDYE